MEELFKGLLSLFKRHGYDVVENEAPPQEEMVSIEVVYEPDTLDGHGEWMSKDTVRKACESFNENLEKGVVKSNLFHMKDTELFTIEKSWIHEELDCIVKGSEQELKAGTWVAKIKFHNQELWELRKAGVVQGVSIGGLGMVDKETGEITEVTFEGEGIA